MSSILGPSPVTPRVAVKLNHTRLELTEPPYDRELEARNMEPAEKWTGVSSGLLEDPESYRARGIWKEPFFGRLMLRPNLLDEDFWHTSAFESDKLQLSDFQSSAGDFKGHFLSVSGATPTNPAIRTTHGSASASIVNLAGLTINVLGSTKPPSRILELASNTLHGWHIKTSRSFARNEGFSFTYTFEDLNVSRVFPTNVVLFGNEFALVLGYGGRAAFWQNQNPGLGDAGWVRLGSINYSEANDSFAGKPITFTILPFALNHIAVYIGDTLKMTEYTGVNSGLYLGPARRAVFKVREQPQYDSANDIYRITDAAPIHFGGLLGQQFSLQVSALRYPTSKEFFLSADYIGPARTGTPQFTTRGTTNRGAMVVAAYNKASQAWDSATDKTTLAPKISFFAGHGMPGSGVESQNVYSPELTSLRSRIDQVITSIARTPVDLTTYWSDIEVQQSTEHEVGHADITTIPSENLYQHRRTAQWPAYIEVTDPYVSDGAGGYSAKTYRIFEGIIKPNRSIIGSQRPVMDFTIRDYWQLLRERPVMNAGWFDGQYLFKAIKVILNGCGFDDSIIVVDDAAKSIKLPLGKNDSDRMFAFHPGDNAQELVGNILEWHSDVRLTPRYARTGWHADDRGSNGAGAGTAVFEDDCVWHLFLDPLYKSNVTISAKFYFAFPTGYSKSDVERYSAAIPELIAEEYEPEVLEPEFNYLYVDAATSTGKDATCERVTHVNVASITDPNSADYLARVKLGYVPPELSGANSLEEALRVAQLLERYAMHTLEVVSFKGEWRPKLRPYDFVELYGIDFSVTPKKLTKLGVFRIEEMNVELNSEFEFARKANYIVKRVANGASFTPVDVNYVTGALGA